MDNDGDKQTTIEDVARDAGVSVATVSRALRDLPNVAPKTRARVQAVARQLSYVADPSAARLAAGRTGTIAVAVPVINQWYFSNVVAGVDAVIKEANFDLLLYVVSSEAHRQQFLAGRGAWWRRSDALILVDIMLLPDEAMRLHAANAQIVTIGVETECFGSVTLDEVGSAANAVRYLIDQGHTRIGLLRGSPHELGFKIPGKRRAGYCQALAEAGIPHDPSLEALGDFSMEGGAEAVASLLDGPNPPTAIFAMSDEMAFGALQELERRHLKAPDDLAVIGFDDNAMSAHLGLTTVSQDVEAVGASAARVLLRAIEKGAQPTERLVTPTSLVVRATAG